MKIRKLKRFKQAQVADTVSVNVFLPPYASNWVKRNKFKVASLLTEWTRMWRPGAASWADFLQSVETKEVSNG